MTAYDPDTLRPVGTVPAELGAGSIAVDAARGRAYCANMLASSVTVFDSVSLRPLNRIAVRECPCKVAVNQATGHLYAARLPDADKPADRGRGGRVDRGTRPGRPVPVT